MLKSFLSSKIRYSVATILFNKPLPYTMENDQVDSIDKAMHLPNSFLEVTSIFKSPDI